MNQVKDVQPIRNQQQLEDMKWALKRHCSERDYMLFVLGCETGLRVGDLLKLKTQKILTLKRKQDKILHVKEGKTQKNRDIYLGNCFQEVYDYAQMSRVPGYFLLEKEIKPLPQPRPIVN